MKMYIRTREMADDTLAVALSEHSTTYTSRKHELHTKKMFYLSGSCSRACAGWRPEYWEYAKSQFVPFEIPQEWTEALKQATRL